jgi:hypothetical protein
VNTLPQFVGIGKCMNTAQCRHYRTAQPATFSRNLRGRTVRER